MENIFDPVLSEEQLAAYLDGMLSTNESYMIEELIDSNPEMMEIQDVIDSVDITYLYETNEDIPIECLADDFSLQDVDSGDHHSMDSWDTEEFVDINSYNEDYDYRENPNNMDNQDGNSETITEDTFMDDGFDGISY